MQDIQEEEKVPMKKVLEMEIVFKVEREAVNRFKEKSEEEKTMLDSFIHVDDTMLCGKKEAVSIFKTKVKE